MYGDVRFLPNDFHCNNRPCRLFFVGLGSHAPKAFLFLTKTEEDQSLGRLFGPDLSCQSCNTRIIYNTVPNFCFKSQVPGSTKLHDFGFYWNIAGPIPGFVNYPKVAFLLTNRFLTPYFFNTASLTLAVLDAISHYGIKGWKPIQSWNYEMKTIIAKMGIHFGLFDRNPYLYYDLHISNHSLCHEHSPPLFFSSPFWSPHNWCCDLKESLFFLGCTILDRHKQKWAYWCHWVCPADDQRCIASIRWL